MDLAVTDHHVFRSAYWDVVSHLRRVRILVGYVKLVLFQACRLKSLTSVRLAGFQVHFGDLGQLVQLYREIFIERHYFCNLPRNAIIIDAGANIGLATLYFKIHYPESRIIAFEPNPETFNCLKKNIEVNHLNGIELHNEALADCDGSITLYISARMAENDIGVSVIKQHVTYFHGEEKLLELTVPCARLSEYIKSEIDLLKLDIEGSEAKVVKELGGLMKNIRNLVMEYHYHATYGDNPLSSIVEVMEQCGHLYQISRNGDHKLSKEQTYLIRSARQ